MKTTLGFSLLPLVCLSISSVAAQVRIEPPTPTAVPKETWLSVFQRSALRTVPPLGFTERCKFVVEGPDSLVLVSHTDLAPTYKPRKEFSSVLNFFWPGTPDTLTVRFADAYCSSASEWYQESPGLSADNLLLLVERDGYYAVLGRLSNATYQYEGEGQLAEPNPLFKPYLYVKGRNGRIDPALIRGRCSEGHCTAWIDGARAYNDSVRAARSNRARAAQSERSRTIRAKGWSPEITKMVLAGQVQIGMTGEMVRSSWGKPTRVNTTNTARGTREQWVYGTGQYVYLENGRVTAIQQSR